MSEFRHINAPMTEAVARSLRAGETIYLSGAIWTGRDAAHKRLVELLEAGKELPISLRDELIYFVGPCPAPPGRVIGSAGPTTAGRMDFYSPQLISQCGLRGMIGKGNRSQAVIDAMKEFGAVYFAATGGAGALIAQCVKKCEVVAFPDLGPEAIYRLEIENLPLIVAIDCDGNNLYCRK